LPLLHDSRAFGLVTRESYHYYDGVRIASLLASGTELVCALGAGEQLVARSHECDYPAWVTRLPCVSHPTFDITGTSGEIDALVRGKLAAGAPLYEVDETALAALRPDVIITQTHCEVCAVTPGAMGDELCRKQVVALRAGTLDGTLAGFGEVAKVIGREREVAELIARIRARLAEVARVLVDVPRVRVACLEWIEPLFHMGNWGPELVALAGGESVLGEPGQHSAAIEWDRVRAADPEALVIAPCGFALDRTLREMPSFADRAGWRELRAVRARRVFVADGNLYFNRSSPSVFASIELLAEMLHPERFPPLHRSAWQRWEA
jgi:iron complex transport system substrate-binding protein